MIESLLTQIILIWAVVDPIGTIPVYLVKTQTLSKPQRIAVAFRAILISAGILLFFIVAGQVLLEAMQIPLSAFQVAGGIILFLFALTMIFGESKPESEMEMTEEEA
ncbi:MAG: MarC family protein, partial [Planctomycetota bacterium]|nr:MarC family protein [Planctomycetota bacterium]